jgi:hypothetical protein
VDCINNNNFLICIFGCFIFIKIPLWSKNKKKLLNFIYTNVYIIYIYIKICVTSVLKKIKINAKK